MWLRASFNDANANANAINQPRLLPANSNKSSWDLYHQFKRFTYYCTYCTDSLCRMSLTSFLTVTRGEKYDKLTKELESELS
jgi:hypothetical protein